MIKFGKYNTILPTPQAKGTMQTAIQNLKNRVKAEQLEVIVICYGGSCSNQLTDVLEKNNYKSRSCVWSQMLCHYPHYIDLGIPIIYLYDNPIKAFLSMKRRGIELLTVNQRKLSNNPSATFDAEKLLKLMINQFNSFTGKRRKDVLILRADELFKPAINSRLQTFLKKPNLTFLPVTYIPPKTDLTTISSDDAALFKKYEKEINSINTFISTYNNNVPPFVFSSSAHYFNVFSQRF
jgi:hypothetical protein